MKSLSKGILGLAVFSLGAGIVFSFSNPKELKVKNIDNKKLAVFIKQKDGSYETSNNIPGVGYTLNQDKSTCSNGAKPTWNNNTLSLGNLTSENTNCYLYFDEDEATKQLNKLGLTVNKGTPDFSKIATEDEGIFAAEDGMYGGTSYYWRGAATTNYVKFAGFCWRIIRINGDGSIRLIYDGTTCHENGTNTAESIAVSSQLYNSSMDQKEYVGWTYVLGKQRPESGDTEIDSNAKVQTEKWYNSNIGNNTIYASKIADGKYCNDRNTAQGYTWSSIGTVYYAGYDRISKNKETLVNPILNCDSKDIYILNSGAITADEVVMAGGKFATENKSYYLYNNKYYWTMTPYYWLGSGAGVFLILDDCRLGGYYVNYGSYGLRPVINLKPDVTFNTGSDGTKDKPFIVEGA